MGTAHLVASTFLPIQGVRKKVPLLIDILVRNHTKNSIKKGYFFRTKKRVYFYFYAYKRLVTDWRH